MVFFDGATSGSIGGAGFFFLLGDTHTLSFYMGCGISTNTRAKLLVLWALLATANLMGICCNLTDHIRLPIIHSKTYI